MKRILMLLLVTYALNGNISAQTGKQPTQAEKTEFRAERMQNHAINMADRLKLDDKTQNWFVPLYMEYCDTLHKLHRTIHIGKNDGLLTAKHAMNDQEAIQYIENSLNMAEKTVNIQREYLAKFKQRLTPQQLLSIFGRNQHPKMKRYKNHVKRHQEKYRCKY